MIKSRVYNNIIDKGACVFVRVSECACVAAADGEKKKRIEPKRNPSFLVKNETGVLSSVEIYR